MNILKKYFKSIRFKTLGLFLGGVIILIGGLMILSMIYRNTLPDSYLYLLMTISSFCISLSSTFVIKYKEAPRVGGLPSFTGWQAVFIGVFALITFGIGFLFSAYELIVGFLAK